MRVGSTSEVSTREGSEESAGQTTCRSALTSPDAMRPPRKRRAAAASAASPSNLRSWSPTQTHSVWESPKSDPSARSSSAAQPIHASACEGLVEGALGVLARKGRLERGRPLRGPQRWRRF
jgi:hypothetical protein